jgi:hypothetical protein
MAVPSQSASSTDRMLKQLEVERKAEADGMSAAWAFLWTLFAFKIATVLIIIYVATGSGESLVMVLVTTWYWFLIPIAAISGPLMIRWRMLKLRRKREQLKRSEWMVDPEQTMTLFPPDDSLPGAGHARS